jgi:hypothetical protein
MSKYALKRVVIRENLKKFFSVSLDSGASAGYRKKQEEKSEGSSGLKSHTNPSILQ